VFPYLILIISSIVGAHLLLTIFRLYFLLHADFKLLMEDQIEEVGPFQLKVNHIKFAVDDVQKFSLYLTEKLKFRFFAKKTSQCNQEYGEILAFKHHSVIFLVQKRLNAAIESTDLIESDKLFDDCYSYSADTAYDICLECNHIQTVVERSTLLKNDAAVVGKIYQVSDSSGSVEFVRMKSPLGNVQHTLVDLTGYQGDFLPGFQTYPLEERDSTIISSIDHVAMCVRVGETDSLISWYNNCFNFRRVLINGEDDATEGFTVKQNDNGLRLKEIICPATTAYITAGFSSGSTFPRGTEPQVDKSTTRLVFAESLNTQGVTNVDTFLQNHCGPGVQHIAFGCPNLVDTSMKLSKELDCVQYPIEYYRQLAASGDIDRLETTVEDLFINHALLEYHSSPPKPISPETLSAKASDIYGVNLKKQYEVIANTNWYILQVFTKPVFPKKTLFFELIQRYNTQTGLGASNIATIWKYQAKNINNRLNRGVQGIKKFIN